MLTPNVSEPSSETLNLEIHDLSRGGNGVARHETPDGQVVVFVPLTVPGDRVSAKVIKKQKRFWEADLITILQPSPDRQKPLCPIFGSCGGCTWQHVPYAMQWKIKKNGSLQALARATVQAPTEITEFPAENHYGYRNRIQLHGKGSQIGFFARGSRALVMASGCPIARKEINEAWSETETLGLEKFASAPEYKVELEVLPDGTIHRSWNSRHGAAGFRQVNDEQNEKLRTWVAAQLDSGSHIFDLYGGNGNLTYDLAKRMQSVDCVDLGSPEGRSEGQPENFHFYRSEVSKWISRKGRDFEGGFFKPDAQVQAVLDPPREGLGDLHDKIADALTAVGATKIIAIGCDPDSWARDLSRFQAKGWKIDKIAIFDFFPQTPHVESVASLVRGG